MSFTVLVLQRTPSNNPWQQYAMCMLNKSTAARALFASDCSLSSSLLSALPPLPARAPSTTSDRSTSGERLPLNAAAVAAPVFPASPAPHAQPDNNNAAPSIVDRRGIILAGPAADLERDTYPKLHHSATQPRRGHLPPPSSALEFKSLRDRGASQYSLGGTSKHRGVMWSKAAKVWRVKLKVKGRTWYLGSHENEAVAAQAYDAASWFISGSKAVINFPCVAWPTGFDA
jgi:hypothetical protein